MLLKEFNQNICILMKEEKNYNQITISHFPSLSLLINPVLHVLTF